MALRQYKKNYDYSYTLGIFPTIELLEKSPQHVITVLLSPHSDKSEGVSYIKDLCKKNDIPFDYSTKALSRLSIADKTYAVGVFKKYEKKIRDNANHVVLVNPSDTGNMGTIIRTMLGFGISDLVLIRPCVDIFDPKTIRATMGAFFDINFDYFDAFKFYEEKYSNHVLYPFMLEGKKTLGSFKFEKPFSLIFGNEGAGLDNHFAKYDNTVKINHSKNIDSLNLSVAAALAMYETFQ